MAHKVLIKKEISYGTIELWWEHGRLKLILPSRWAAITRMIRYVTIYGSLLGAIVGFTVFADLTALLILGLVFSLTSFLQIGELHSVIARATLQHDAANPGDQDSD